MSCTQAIEGALHAINPDDFFFAGESGPLRPAAVASALGAVAVDEDVRSASVEAALEDAARAVEAVRAANDARLRFVREELPAALRGSFGVFWTEDKLRDHFGLGSVLDERGLADDGAVPDFEGAGDFSMPLETLASGSFVAPVPIRLKRAAMGRLRITMAKGGDGIRPEVAAAVSEDAKRPDHSLLQPQSHFAPLRRLFAPLLRSRAAAPQSLHLLLDHLERGQRVLADLEGKMHDCILDLPVASPMQELAMCVSRDLRRPPAGQAVEEGFFAEHKHVLEQLDAAPADVLASHRLVDTPLPAGISSAKASLGAAMWGCLLSEAAGREVLHARAVDFVQSAVDAERRQEGIATELLAACSSRVMSGLSAIDADVEMVAASTESALARLEEVARTGQQKHTENKAALAEVLRESSWRLKSSCDKQDKLRRSIHQLFKELDKEQTRFNGALAEVTSATLHTARLDACYDDFKAAIEQRRPSLEAALRTCNDARAISAEAQTYCREALAAMKQHAQRELGAETMRKCTATKVATHNCLQWRRTLCDLEHLYSLEHESVTSKHGSSWQLDFLLSGARKQAAEQLAWVRDASERHGRAWRALVEEFAEPFEVAVPTLTSFDVSDQFVAARHIYAELEHARRHLRRKRVPALSWEDLSGSPQALRELLDPWRAAADDYEVDQPDMQPTAGAPSPPAGEPRLRDNSLQARVLVPAIAKFEAELQALHDAHAMRNPSDYTNKSMREAERATDRVKAPLVPRPPHRAAHPSECSTTK